MKKLIMAISMLLLLAGCNGAKTYTGNPQEDGEKYANLIYDALENASDSTAEDIMQYLAFEGSNDMQSATKQGMRKLDNAFGSLISAFTSEAEGDDDFKEAMSMFSSILSNGFNIGQNIALDSTKVKHGKELLKNAIEFRSDCEQQYKQATTEKEFKTLSGKYFEFEAYTVTARTAVTTVYAGVQKGIIKKEDARDNIGYAFHPELLETILELKNDEKEHEDYEKWKNSK